MHMRNPGFLERNSNEIKFWFRVAAFFTNRYSRETKPGVKKVRAFADKLIHPRLQPLTKYIKQSDIAAWTDDTERNCKAYHRLCLTFINLILSRRKYKIVSAAAPQFDINKLQDFFDVKDLPRPQGPTSAADFEASNNRRNLIFCFYDQKDPRRGKILKEISAKVCKQDSCNFDNTCFLIVPSQAELYEYRQVDRADNWRRGFIICFDELAEKAKSAAKNKLGHLEPPFFKNKNYAANGKIEIFNAKILKNTPVGTNNHLQHYKIKFEAKELQSVVPGQFVMIDTQKKSKKQAIFKPPVLKSLTELSRQSSHKIIKPLSYLKRPFSIHRAFYKNFQDAYLKNISLPQELATIAHTVFPDKFDIFYKVMEDGVGTNELKSLKPDDIIQMLGPLGEKQKLDGLTLKGIKEVHLIGGGVGMAPLVFFGQGLRYYSLKIKAFIGVQNLDTLLNPLNSGPADKRKDSYAYIDDLSNIGLKKSDIYISHETKEYDHHFRPGLPKKNYYQGFVTDQYKAYLANIAAGTGILAITCGPTAMAKALNKITSKVKIPLRVLLEKRMGCGIGVCMSCVCPTKKDNREQYSRVCVDGPLFNAEDIDWENI